jgi:peptidyl-prolyl cis-trans isomerase B (cyclophilin B)
VSTAPQFAPPHPHPPGQRVHPAQQHRRDTDGIAIAALVVAFFCWPVGIVLSLVALRRLRRYGRQGRPLAVAGLTLSIFGFVCSLLVLVVVLFLAYVAGDVGGAESETVAVGESSHGGSFGGGAETSNPPLSAEQLAAEETVIDTQRQDVRTLQATLTAVFMETGAFPLTGELSESLVVLHPGNHLVNYTSEGNEYSLKVTSDNSHTDLLFKSPVGGQLYRVPES